MRRSAVILCTAAFSVAALPLKSQFYFYNNRYYENPLGFELGGSAGVMNSLTDLGGKKGIGKNFIKDLNWKNAKPSFSVYALAMYKYAVGVRVEGTFGKVQGADSSLKSVAASTFGRYERNLNFKSKITDVQLALEIHPLFFREYDENEAPYFSPYLVAGVGYFSFDPQAEINGQLYSLQPLRTEGQGFAEYRGRIPYKLSQINFPAGIGVRYEVNSFLNARIEIVHRILQTDYLDDVSKDYIDPALFNSYLPSNQAAIAQQLFDRQSELNGGHTTQVGSQRGNPKNNDAYFTIQVKLGITLGRLRR